jgi:hypothetical protein
MPHPGPQTLFHQSNAYELLFGGAKGPGKTECLLRESTRQVANPRYRGIIFRRTYPQLGEVIDRSFKYFLKLEAKPKYSDKDLALKLPAWTWPSGAKVAFGSVQHEKDKYNYQGKEFHYQGFDQLEQFNLSQYLYLIAQNRTSDNTIRCYIRATANPGGVGHAWVKSRFIDRLLSGQVKHFKRVNDDDFEVSASDQLATSRSFIFSTLFDNPSVDKNYVRTLMQLSETDQRAFIHGDWDAFSGQFFPMWRNSLHIQERHISEDFQKFISLDYGFSNPSSVIWWQVDYDGNMHAYREIYKEGFTYENLARKIMELTPNNEKISYVVADPAIFGDKSHHKGGFEGESGAETMQKEFGHFTSVIRGDNDRVIGWGRLKNLLTPDEGGFVRMTFSSRCKESTRTIPALIYDEGQNGVVKEDLNTDGEDHAADSIRYGAMSRPAPTERPVPKVERKSFDWWMKLNATASQNESGAGNVRLS